MIGQGVLRECLLDSGVQLVKTVGRTTTGVQYPKLREVAHRDLWNYSSIEMELWARVKGRTENALLRLPFKAAYMFRPGFIQPLHRIRSRTTAYRVFYVVTKPLLPVLRRAFPDSILTTEQIWRAMLAVARKGAPKRIRRVRISTRLGIF
jgi:hypothetical protein